LSGIDGGVDATHDLFKNVYPSVNGKLSMPNLEFNRGMFKQHALLTWGHLVFGPLALLLSPFQLISALRERRPRLHRRMGFAFVFCQAIGVPCGTLLGLHEWAGPVAAWAFAGMGLTSLSCTAMALRAIFARDVAAHRRWMIRGFSVMWCSVVLLRLAILFVIPAVAEVPRGFGTPYTALIFLSWTVGLLLGELYLFATRSHPSVVALARSGPDPRIGAPTPSAARG
jgi:hypothetical protein